MESSKKVVIIGLPGSGKTTIGNLLHEKGYSWIDLDKVIEAKSNRSIREIVRVEGEQSFREKESAALKAVFLSGTQVISVGGGCLGRIENMELIKKASHVVCLKSDYQELTKRVLDEEQDNPKRPVIFPNGILSIAEVTAKIKELGVKREQDYQIANIELVTDYTKVDNLVEILVELFEKPLSKDSKIKVIPFKTNQSAVSDSLELQSKSSTLICELKILSSILNLSKIKVAIIIDENVKQHLADYISQTLDLSKHLVIEVASGEESKSFKSLESILNKLIEKGFTRKDYIIAVGGGVVGDLAGLVASIYMRGLNLIQVPTTLVAQVDSAIGGKTAINLEAGKNTVGTTYPAKYVLCDTKLLKTLQQREYISGLGEVVKYALTYSKDFFELLENNIDKIKLRDEKIISEIIEFCVVKKTAVISNDLCDVSGIRAILNFGHTVGHAIERMTQYKRFLHGEAISIGMVEALYISSITSGLKIAEIERIVLLLKNLGLPVQMPEDLLQGATELEFDKKKFLKDLRLENNQTSSFRQCWEEVIRADKKRESDKVKYITLKRLGEAEVVELDVSFVVGCVAWNKADLSRFIKEVIKF